jgi:hypothetical protein
MELRDKVRTKNDRPECRRDRDVAPERPERADGRFRPELVEGRFRPELAEGRFSVLSLPKGKTGSPGAANSRTGEVT